MSSTDGTKLQVNFKTHDGMLINVYAANQDELVQGLAVLADTSAIITSTATLLNGVAAAAPLTQPQAPVAPPVPQAPAAPVPPQPTPVAAAPVAAHVCIHGNRVFKSGVGSKGPWAAYFCPEPKDSPTNCGAEWVKV